MPDAADSTPIISFVSLGCPKNVVDGENMLGKLVGDGFQLSADPAIADIIIVNTCSFIEAARQESVAHIKEMAEYKKNGKCQALVVSGCMAQRYSETLLDELPEVDALLGVSRIQDVDALCRQLLARNGNARRITQVAEPDDLVQDYQARLRFQAQHYAYLKISEGCNQKCAFCAIPNFRGILKSRPIEDLTREAADQIATGAKEIILISQDSSSYGWDIYERKRRIADLARAVAALDGLEWLRIMYHYPTSYPMDLIDEIAANPKIVKYIDMPLQHISDDVLLRMKRGINRAKIETLLGAMREKIPGLVLRTTFLVGFPGETEAQFEELCGFVRDFGFDRMGAFAYSFEKDTTSAAMPGHLPEAEKEARRDRLMEIQQEVAFAANRKKIGQVFRVLVDGFDAEMDCHVGRTYGDCPQIDNVVYFKAAGKRQLRPGDFVNVKISRAQEYDLIGRQVAE